MGYRIPRNAVHIADCVIGVCPISVMEWNWESKFRGSCLMLMLSAAFCDHFAYVPLWLIKI
jgi:hypothetical protein